MPQSQGIKLGNRYTNTPVICLCYRFLLLTLYKWFRLKRRGNPLLLFYILSPFIRGENSGCGCSTSRKKEQPATDHWTQENNEQISPNEGKLSMDRMAFIAGGAFHIGTDEPVSL